MCEEMWEEMWEETCDSVFYQWKPVGKWTMPPDRRTGKGASSDPVNLRTEDGRSGAITCLPLPALEQETTKSPPIGP